MKRGKYIWLVLVLFVLTLYLILVLVISDNLLLSPLRERFTSTRGPLDQPCRLPIGGQCDDGEHLVNGCCVRPVCLDSDGGKIKEIAGYATSWIPGMGDSLVEYDLCQDEGTLFEMYCSPEGTISSEEIACDETENCVEGACVSTVVWTDLSACTIINQPGYYRLVTDLTNAAFASGGRSCIDIRADDVVFDCDGHAIRDTLNHKPGILSDKARTKISDCVVTMSAYQQGYPSTGGTGISVRGQEATVERNVLIHNALYGLDVSGTGHSIKDNLLTRNHPGQFGDGYSLYLHDAQNSVIINNTFDRSRYGLFIISSTGNIIENNTISRQTNYGLSLVGLTVSGNSITGNLFHSNYVGLTGRLNPNIIQSNTFTENRLSVAFDQTVDYSLSNNEILNDAENLIHLKRGNLDLDPFEEVHFNFTLQDLRGQSCGACLYEITVTPSEVVTHSRSGDLVRAYFTPQGSGYYHVLVTLSDSKGNTFSREYSYIVGARESVSVSYFMRGFEPTNGQPSADAGGFDSGALLFTPPTQSETRFCSTWFQLAPDELPAVPVGYLSRMDVSMFYALEDQQVAHQFLGFQNIATFDFNKRDFSVYLPATYPEEGDPVFDYGEFSVPISGVMDSPSSWYWAGVKMTGARPAVVMNSTDPAIVTFTYEVPAD